ncbi:hypothetical protein AB4225_36550 [Streptomyces sp. 2RAF24]|uniref:hypothetical protein n=1 Tax=Streptomyces sp. 2RAF24 TaxID=3232997 RepID=UPI003F9553BF
MPALVTVAVLFLIVFGAAGYTVFHLKPTPVRIAAVLIAMGALIAALAPIVRILAEPQPASQPAAPPAAASPQLPGSSPVGHHERKGM